MGFGICNIASLWFDGSITQIRSAMKMIGGGAQEDTGQTSLDRGVSCENRDFFLASHVWV